MSAATLPAGTQVLRARTHTHTHARTQAHTHTRTHTQTHLASACSSEDRRSGGEVERVGAVAASACVWRVRKASALSTPAEISNLHPKCPLQLVTVSQQAVQFKGVPESAHRMARAAGVYRTRSSSVQRPGSVGKSGAAEWPESERCHKRMDVRSSVTSRQGRAGGGVPTMSKSVPSAWT